MATEPAPCVHHPERSTRLACARCEEPICTACVRRGAVGQLCPSCARPPGALRAQQRQRRLKAGVVGFAVALLGGLLVSLIGVGSLILSGVTGFLVGRAVVSASAGLADETLPTLAAVVAVAGLAVAFVGLFATPVPGRGLLVLSYPIAAFLAYRTASDA